MLELVDGALLLCGNIVRIASRRQRPKRLEFEDSRKVASSSGAITRIDGLGAMLQGLRMEVLRRIRGS